MTRVQFIVKVRDFEKTNNGKKPKNIQFIVALKMPPHGPVPLNVRIVIYCLTNQITVRNFGGPREKNILQIRPPKNGPLPKHVARNKIDICGVLIFWHANNHTIMDSFNETVS
jgi:hypothetical protein